MKKHKWTAPQLIAFITTIGLILLLVGSMTQQLLVSGYDYGKYTEEELPTDLFDFFDALAGRKSQYKKEMTHLQSTGFWALLLVCIPFGLILVKASKTHKDVGATVFAGACSSIVLWTCLLVLFYFHFPGSARIAMWVIFFLTSILLGIYIGISCKYMGLYAIALLIFISAIGLFIGIFLAQIIGLAAVIFQELFWIILVALTCAGGGTTTIVIVRVI